MAYGSCWGNNLGWSQVDAVKDTWYPITDTGIDSGQLSDVTNADGLLTVGATAKYLVNYSVSISGAIAPKNIETALYVNSAASTNGRCSVSGMGLTLAGTAILDLTDEDTVRVAIRGVGCEGMTLGVNHVTLSVLSLA